MLRSLFCEEMLQVVRENKRKGIILRGHKFHETTLEIEFRDEYTRKDIWSTITFKLREVT